MSGKTMLKPSRFFMLPAALLLAGCAQMSGLGDLSLLSTQPDATAAVAPAAETQVAALGPEEMPPMPTRRPGKRPRTPATATQPEPAPAATAEAAKPESSGISLASLTNISLFSTTESPDKILIDKPPVDAYSLLAQRIKYCWLNPTTPRLTNHGFHAEIPAGEVREAKMIVYEKAPDGRRGTSAFKIDITAESSGALVSMQNVQLSKTDDSALKADMARWAKGDDRCKL